METIVFSLLITVLAHNVNKKPNDSQGAAYAHDQADLRMTNTLRRPDRTHLRYPASSTVTAVSEVKALTPVSSYNHSSFLHFFQGPGNYGINSFCEYPGKTIRSSVAKGDFRPGNAVGDGLTPEINAAQIPADQPCFKIIT